MYFVLCKENVQGAGSSAVFFVFLDFVSVYLPGFLAFESRGFSTLELTYLGKCFKMYNKSMGED